LNIKAVKDQVKQQIGLEEPVPSTSIEEGDSRRRQDEEEGDDGDTSDDGMRSYYHGNIGTLYLTAKKLKSNFGFR
jgi:hypothetical protein